FPKDYDAKIPMWGFAANPLLDGERLICLVGGKGSVAVAFNKDTGKEIWRALSASEPGYCPPTIVKVQGAGTPRQLILRNPDSVTSLNPETGAVYWSHPVKIKAGLSVPTPRLVGDKLFVTAFYNGPLMLSIGGEQPKAKVVWKGKGRGEKPEQTDGL